MPILHCTFLPVLAIRTCSSYMRLLTLSQYLRTKLLMDGYSNYEVCTQVQIVLHTVHMYGMYTDFYHIKFTEICSITSKITFLISNLRTTQHSTSLHHYSISVLFCTYFHRFHTLSVHIFTISIHYPYIFSSQCITFTRVCMILLRAFLPPQRQKRVIIVMVLATGLVILSVRCTPQLLCYL